MDLCIVVSQTSWTVVWLNHLFDQIIAISHDLGHQKVAEEEKWDPYFREI